jgi:hypothetical protein
MFHGVTGNDPRSMELVGIVHVPWSYWEWFTFHGVSGNGPRCMELVGMVQVPWS